SGRRVDRLRARVPRADPPLPRAPLRDARYRRVRPQRLSRQAARILRGQPLPRRGCGAEGTRRRGRGQAGHGGRGDREICSRHRASRSLDRLMPDRRWTDAGGAMEVRVPDIGDFKDVPVIEVLVRPGDSVAAEDPLVTLESDKATMDVPAPAAGTVGSIRVKAGDKVSEGSVLLVLDAATPAAATPKAPVSAPPAPAHGPAGVVEVKVPDIGDFKDVPVIEIMVKPGDTVAAEDPLVTLESDKATMDVPAPFSGDVRELRVKVGDKVSEGSVIVTLAAETASAPAAATVAPTEPRAAATVAPTTPAAVDEKSFALAYAGPGVRKLARELGIDLGRVTGSGNHGRIVKEDVEAFAKSGTAAPSGAGIGGIDLLPWPHVDFAKFGPIETKPLSRIKKISAANLHRNWVMIPHVTNHDDADITELEAFRVELNKENDKRGIRVSMLAFIIKAVCATLARFPEFNASLDGDSLVLKKYYHIGFA